MVPSTVFCFRDSKVIYKLALAYGFRKPAGLEIPCESVIYLKSHFSSSLYRGVLPYGVRVCPERALRASAARVYTPGTNCVRRNVQRTPLDIYILLDTITDLTNKSNTTRTPYSGGVYRLPPAR